MPRMSAADQARFHLEQRISGFERFEAAADPTSNAKPCCKTKGNLRAVHGDRVGCRVAYRCQVCRCRHIRIFADLSGLTKT